MPRLLRHLVAIAILPFTVGVLVPFWLARRYRITFSLGTTGGALVLQGAGCVILIIGLLLFFSSLRRFAAEGRGTLAPWDPPRRLVVQGPYRFVRNPMISGVVFVLLGEAMLLRSSPHALWALTFLAINLVYIPLLEEPFLRLRFGDAYREYCRHVPRVLPRLRPWGGSTLPMKKSRTWLPWLGLIAGIAVVELLVRFALPFDLRRVLVVEAMLFGGAALVARSLISRRPPPSGWRRVLPRALVWAFALGALRAAIWASGQPVMRANMATLLAAIVVLIGSRLLGRRRDGPIYPAD